MRRVAVTGMGIVSSIGADAGEVPVLAAAATPGIVAAPRYAELGFRCQVHADPGVAWEAHGRPPGRAVPGRRAPPTPIWPWSRRSPTPVLNRTRSPTSAPA